MANIPASYYDRYTLDTWFERDRAHVGLTDSRTGKEVLDLWDDDVRQLVEDGFLDPKDYHGSAIEYAMHLGAIPKPRKAQNPGAAWHKEQGQRAERQVKREQRAGRSGRYFSGQADAHTLSAHESRKMGLNPVGQFRLLKPVPPVTYPPYTLVVSDKPVGRKYPTWQQAASVGYRKYSGKTWSVYDAEGNRVLTSADMIRDRKMGLNPRKIGKRQFVAVRYVTSRNTAQLRLTSGEVVDIQPHVLKRFSPEMFDRALTYPDAWVEVSGKNPRGARTLVGRVFKAERWARRWARGRPIRKVKGGWQILAGRTRTPAQERAHRQTVRNPDIEMTFNSKAKAVRYASAMRKLGHDIEVVQGQYGTWKTIIREPRKNPIAVYNPPPGRIIYGRVLAVEAQKTNGSHRGKRFRHSFAGDSRVAAYAMPDGSVLLKSAAGKRLWADR